MRWDEDEDEEMMSTENEDAEAAYSDKSEEPRWLCWEWINGMANTAAGLPSFSGKDDRSNWAFAAYFVWRVSTQFERETPYSMTTYNKPNTMRDNYMGSRHALLWLKLHAIFCRAVESQRGPQGIS